MTHEIISYQYAMGTLLKEIHQDKTTESVLFYLLYCPWGFEKVIPASGEDPAVVTPYYYIFDQAGLVKAITDDEGDILESYEYSPYGELLTTPTISQYRFVSGREECIWDQETKLYYMHARYYDAVTGRFLSKDSVRGSLTAPISLNRYIYCQNDPITLADPSGNSPYNTGLPERKGDPGDQIEENLNVGGSCIPELASSDLGLIPNPLNHQNDQCYLIYTNGSYDFIDITLPNGKTFRLVLSLDKTGKVISIYGYIVGEDNSNLDSITQYFVKGIVAGFQTLMPDNKITLSLNEIAAICVNVSSMKDYYDEFCQILGYEEGKVGWVGVHAPEQFMKHAIIGGYIASKMIKFTEGNSRKSSDLSYDRFDTIFGFWVSFWAEQLGLKNKIFIDRKYPTNFNDTRNMDASLVDELLHQFSG